MDSQLRWRTILAAAATVLFSWAISYALARLSSLDPKAAMKVVLATMHEGWFGIIRSYIVLLFVPVFLKGIAAGALALGITFLIPFFRRLNAKAIAGMALAGFLALDVALSLNALVLRGIPWSTNQRIISLMATVISTGLLGKALGLLIVVLVVRFLRRREAAAS
jgi:hypothetical protein